MNAITQHEDRALNAHLARVDRFTELDELSFKTLLELEDELSEGGDWSTLDDVKAEIAERRSEAEEALAKLFVAQCKAGGEVPRVEGAKIGVWTMAYYFGESIGAGWADLATDVLFGTASRDRLFSAMATEYAELVCEDLLKAGWSAQ